MRLYNTDFPTNDQIEIELKAIRKKGRWMGRDGRPAGNGMVWHMKRLQNLIAPWKKWDRWSELLLRNFCENRMTIVVGPANSTKTHNMAFFGLCMYAANPNSTTVLMSSTDSRSLEYRVWGEFKKLWSAARALSDSIPGRLIESRQILVTDDEDQEGTDFRNGVVAIPCIVGNTFVGLSRFVGVKNKHIILLADELSFMHLAFYDAISNLNKNPGFKCAGSGNPKDRTDTLGKLAEPASEVGGWEGVIDDGKTRFWPTRFEGGRCICLDGRDSPNNDEPNDQFPYIINTAAIDRDIALYGADSIQVSMFNYGVFPRDAQARRVLTRTICERGKALEDVVWQMPPIRLVGLDAAYGAIGGDRCVMSDMSFGTCVDGVQRLAFNRPPLLIPVKGGLDATPEEQIADFLSGYCSSEGIEAHRCGLDSTGRGTLVSAFARLKGENGHANPWTAIICVEFGGAASERQVSIKIPIECRRYYANFVTELWYQFRYTVESDQIRRLPTDVMDEMCMRGWDFQGKKIKVETKEDMKLRIGKSPDVADSAVVGLEVARRLGFRVGGQVNVSHKAPDWLERLQANHKKLTRSYSLTASYVNVKANG